MNEINGFTFYRNYYEIIRYLSPKDKILLYDAILEYMFEDKEPELKELLKGIWVNVKMVLDNNKKNINNGKKGGRPKTQVKPKHNPNETQQEPKTKPNNISYFIFIISNNNYKYILDDTKIYNKIMEWLEYKQERKEIYKETGLKSLLSQIDNQIEIYGEDAIVELINDCMASNYKGIIFDKLKNKKIINTETLPDWYNKNIDKQEISKEEQEELDNLLKDF